MRRVPIQVLGDGHRVDVAIRVDKVPAHLGVQRDILDVGVIGQDGGDCVLIFVLDTEGVVVIPNAFDVGNHEPVADVRT